MKSFLSLCLLVASILSAHADDADQTLQDTIIKTRTTVAVRDTINGLITETVTEEKRIVQTAQESSSDVFFDGDSYNFIFSWKKKNKFDPHWTGLGMGFMNYNDSDIPYGRLILSRSHNFTVNLFDYHKQIKNSNWLLVSGVGFEFSRYHFRDNAALTIRDGVTSFVPAPDGITYNSSKLLVYYVTFPLLLEYQTGGMHILGGVVGFLKYYSKSQINYYTENGRQVQNMGRDLNIRPFDLKLRLQAGIGGISLYGYYSPFSMFSKDRGPDLRTYTIGVMIGI